MFPWGNRARQVPEKPPPSGPAINAFGKVPGLPEYVRAGPPSAVSAAVEEWFVSATEWGAHYRAARWKAEFDAGNPQWFVLHAPGDSSVIIAGVAVPSHDSVGRRFPLALFALLPSQTLLYSAHLAPALFRDFFDDATSILRALSGAKSPADFAQLAERLGLPDTSTVPHLDSSWRYWAETPALDLFETIFPELPVDSAQAALHAILDAASPFRGTESPRTSLGLRLPLSPRNPVMSAAFWLESIRLCAGWTQTVPAWFAPEFSSARSILVQLGDQPPPSAIADLWMPDESVDQVCDLTRPHQLKTASFSLPLPATLAAIVRDPDSSVASVLAFRKRI